MTLQVPANLKEEGGREGVHGLALPRCPQHFLQQTFAFSVRWSDDSNTLLRRSWDEFRRLHVSEPGLSDFPQLHDTLMTPAGVLALTPTPRRLPVLTIPASDPCPFQGYLVGFQTPIPWFSPLEEPQGDLPGRVGPTTEI